MTALLVVSMSTLFAAISKILGLILIVEVGLLLATLVAKAVASLLPANKCNDLSERAGFTGFMLMDAAEADKAQTQRESQTPGARPPRCTTCTSTKSLS